MIYLVPVIYSEVVNDATTQEKDIVMVDAPDYVTAISYVNAAYRVIMMSDIYTEEETGSRVQLIN